MGVTSKHRGIGFFIKGFIGCTIFAYLVVKTDISLIANVLAVTQYRYLAAGLMVVFSIRVLLAWQMTLPIRHHGMPLSLAEAFVINTIVSFYGMFLPAGISGGVIKWYRLSKPSGKRAEVFAALFILKLINLVVIFFPGCIALLINNPFRATSFVFIPLAAFSISIVGIICIFFTKIIDRLSSRIVINFPYGFLAPMATLFEKVWKAVTHFRKLPAGESMKLLLAPLLLQGLIAVLFFCVAKAIDLNLPISVLIWTGAMVFLVQHIPISLSGLGLREGALVMLLPHYGVLPAEAMAFSLVLLAYTLLMGAIGGILEIADVFFHRRLFSSPSKIR